MESDYYVDVDSAEEIARLNSKASSSLHYNKSNSRHNNKGNSFNNRGSPINGSRHAVDDDSAPLEEMLPKLAKRKSNQTPFSDSQQNMSSAVDDNDNNANTASPRMARKQSRASLVVEQSNGLGQFEALRTTDILTDANSAASQAFDALNDHRPNISSAEKKKVVDGREIRQEHELYGMTYGMMLGIRVLTGRRELYNYGLESPSGSEKQKNDIKSMKNRMLTDEDYDYELELEFPPQGSKGRSTQGNISHPLYATPPHKLSAAFKFKDYMANVFHAIRSQAGIDEAEYMMSIAGDFNYIEFIANSKSGQFFFYSHDGKYMIKTQTKEESKLLRNIMPQYVGHLAQNNKSLLVRFFGMYRVKMAAVSRAPIYFVVMSSVFHSDLPIHTKYDVKGSTIGRLVNEKACAGGAVQKDLNLLNSGRTLRLGAGLVDVFLDVLSADALFLRTLRIMDYSLLIGIHEVGSAREGRRMSGVVLAGKKSHAVTTGMNPGSRNMSRRGSFISKGDKMFNSYHGGILAAPHNSTGVRDEVYFFGIIDILQLYNNSKRAETFFKGITSNSRELSSVDPDFYAIRFISFVTDVTDYAAHRSKTPERSPVARPPASPSRNTNSNNTSSSQFSPSSIAAALIAKLSPRQVANSEPPSASASPVGNGNSNKELSSKSLKDKDSRKVFFSDDGNDSSKNPRSDQSVSPRSKSPSPSPPNKSSSSPINRSPKAVSPRPRPSPTASNSAKQSSVSMSASLSNQSKPSNIDAFMSQSLKNSNNNAAAPNRIRMPATKLLPSDSHSPRSNDKSSSRQQQQPSSYDSTSRQDSDAYDDDDSDQAAMSQDRLSKHPSFMALRGSNGMSYRGRGSGRTKTIVHQRRQADPTSSTSASTQRPFRFESAQSLMNNNAQAEKSDAAMVDNPRRKRNGEEGATNPHFGSGALRKQSFRNTS